MRRIVFGLGALLLAACQVGAPGVALPRPSGSVADVFADVDATAAASPAPSVAPSPLASPLQTGRALDVALAGPGGFALALVRDPQDLKQVRLTRRGRFGWQRVTDDQGQAWWRLVSEDGVPVLGYELASADPDPWPRPGRGRGFYAAFGLDGGFYRPRVIELDASANPLPDAGFDYRGLIRLAGRWDGSAELPVDDQGRPRALFLAVARPDGEELVGAIADDLRVGWLESP
jgi:hypothetical protein